MAQETEIKLRINDVRELRRKLKRLGAKLIIPRTWEVNVLFDTAESSLKTREELLRIRTESLAASKNRHGVQRGRVLLTFKRPIQHALRGTSQRHKTREELELEASDGLALAQILLGLGLRQWFRYEKFRTTYSFLPRARWAKGLLIEVDETPIGFFTELEGPAAAIDRAAKELGFSQRDYIVSNYMELYREHCRERGADSAQMVFAKQSTTRAAKKSKKSPKSVGFS